MSKKPNKIFLTDIFTATEWDTAEIKLKFANQLLNFIAADFPEARFSKVFYNRLSMSFGFIAHYVEGVIMRSVNTKIAQTHHLDGRTLRIIPAQICSQKP